MTPNLTVESTPASRVNINLFGDRHIEWSWVAAHIPAGPGEALEFGPGESWLALVAVHRGFNVTTVDLEATSRPYVEPNLHDIQSDLLKLDQPEGRYDLVINCSAVEHAGLAGRYGVTEERPDGDLEVMAKLHRLMKPAATMILTIPIGIDAVFPPMARVYGEQRLPRLLERFDATREAYWVKDEHNRWTRCSKQAATAFEAQAGNTDWRENIYALGCYMLRRV